MGVADGCRVELVHGGLIRSWDQVPVGVHRDLDAVVAELVLHVHETLPIGQEQAGVCVTEVMKPDVPQAGEKEAAP